MRKNLLSKAALIAILGLASCQVSLASTADTISTKKVTWEDIANDQDTPENVLMYGMGNKAQRYSPLTEINTETVKDLVPVWNYSFGGEKQRGQESQALVHDGIIYVTGPTGSGKTTTLYMILEKLAQGQINISTIEDPVERKLNRINQMQVNTMSGLTFDRGLRALMRQDPDVIMVGETRDKETAEISVRAAITGHLVVSTLHTNDAISTIVRLEEMGVEPYMVSSSMLGVIAQKLVRRLCPECKQAYDATDDELRLLGLPITKQLTLYKPGQCPACNNIGYKGRIAVHEVMPVSRSIKNAIHLGKTTDEIDTIAREEGMISLRDNLKKLLYDGIISFDTFIDTVSEIYQED